MASTLSSIVSEFKSLGLSGTTLAAAIQDVASASPTSTIESYCQTILQNSNNPTVVSDMATKLAETQNLPIAVENLLAPLRAAAVNAATNPMAVVQVVQAIETALGPSQGLSLGPLSL